MERDTQKEQEGKVGWWARYQLRRGSPESVRCEGETRGRRGSYHFTPTDVGLHMRGREEGSEGEGVGERAHEAGVRDMHKAARTRSRCHVNGSTTLLKSGAKTEEGERGVRRGEHVSGMIMSWMRCFWGPPPETSRSVMLWEILPSCLGKLCRSLGGLLSRKPFRVCLLYLRCEGGLGQNELFSLLEHEHLQNAAILVLANKQDLKDAMAVADLTQTLNLHSVKKHDWHIQVQPSGSHRPN